MQGKRDTSIRLFVLLFIAVTAGSGTAFLQQQTIAFGFLDHRSFVLLAASYTALTFFLLAVAAWWGKDKKSIITFLILSILLIFSLVYANRTPLPHVLLLVSDATRADHLSVYGYQRSTTPFLEGFAQDCIVFNQAMAQGTHTIVSTPSIVASAYPSNHQLTDYRKVLSSDFVLISEMLQAAHYATYGCAANPHLGFGNGFAQGYNRYTSPRGWEEADAHKVLFSLFDWLPERAEKPFFGFLFCIDPHTPYSPPPPYDKLFDPTWEGEATKGGRNGQHLPERTLYNMIAQYDGEIAFVDHTMKQFIKKLKELKIYESTLIIYTSDHGEALYDREAFYGHGEAPYEEVAHVPLIIRFPSPIKFPEVTLTGRYDEVVSHVDILPSVAEYLHLPCPETAQGESFLPIIRQSQPATDRCAFLEEILQQYGPCHIQAVRTTRYKLIEFLHYGTQKHLSRELYDLETDPREQINLVNSRPDIAASLERKIKSMKETASRQPAKAPKEVTPDDTILEGLRALGYTK